MACRKTKLTVDVGSFRRYEVISRDEVFSKYNGFCAYSGTPLEDDWQIEHVIPKRRGGGDSIENLVPVQRLINHYKRALTLEEFRTWYLDGLHIRLKKVPKNPWSEKGIRRKIYMLKVASYFDITPDKPFCGKFYFEQFEEG